MQIFTKHLHVWRLALPWRHFEKFKLRKRSRVPNSNWHVSGVIFGHAIHWYS